MPPIVWQPSRRGIILNTRPKKSAHAYGQIWCDEGSPLAVITRAQADALNGAFGADVLVDWAMRYGNPAIPDRLRAMKAAGRSEEHTSELQSLMRISYAVFCLKTKKKVDISMVDRTDQWIIVVRDQQKQ